MTRPTLFWSAILLLTGGIAFSAWAVNKSVNLKLVISINAPPPCTITGGTVEFGTVLTTKVDGSSNVQPVNYSLNCSGRVSDYLKMQIQGTALTVNGESVLKTDKDGLGIRLQTTTGKTLVSVGTSGWLNFQAGSSGPALQAVLVKPAGTTLAAGEFNAAATMVVDYQ